MYEAFVAKKDTKSQNNMLADMTKLEDMMDNLLRESVIASGFKAGTINGYAMGGIANTPSIFGEAGPEAAVPLPDGRTIPVSLNKDFIVNSISSTISSILPTSNNQTTETNTETTDREMIQEIIELRKDVRQLLAALNNSTQEGNKAVVRAISEKFKDNRVLRS
jgi:ElaB/YqjD/DUF883 family membrane-anchored ribosome-binding protein